MSSLLQRIIERIEQSGPITFADYMRMALYEPGYGYYVTGPAKMGWEGDYYTSTDVADFFAHCMGRQLYECWEQIGKPEPFIVIEQGAGRGHLAAGVQQWAEQEAPELARVLEYRTADIRTGQDALTALDHGKGPHVMISNELVDAFPVHIVQKQGEWLYEVYVEEHNGRLQEALGEPSSQDVAHYLDRYHVRWQGYEDGWRAEVNLDALQWMERSAQILLGPNPRRKRRGFLVVIDYGDSAKELYSPYRRHGTLASYFQHQFSERPLARPGEQDITAHVNFSALIQAGRQQGLRLHKLTTQRKWLIETGIYEELEQIHKREFGIIETNRASDQGQIAMFQWINLRQRVSALTDPAGMGNFKVLIMKR